MPVLHDSGFKFCVGGGGRETADITSLVVLTGPSIGLRSPQSTLMGCMSSIGCLFSLLKRATYCVKPLYAHSPWGGGGSLQFSVNPQLLIASMLNKCMAPVGSFIPRGDLLLCVT